MLKFGGNRFSFKPLFLGSLSDSLRFRWVSLSSRVDSPVVNGNSASNRPLPSEADVVVIGGGMVGCSTTYHLAKITRGKIIQLERDKLTSGTTWHTAGLLWQLRPHEREFQIIQHTRDLMTKILPEETGMDTGWVPTGGLFTAVSKERLDEYQIMSTLGEVFGIESHVLSPEESLKIHPLLNTSDLYGTLYSPMDGTIDPSGACTTFAKAAAKYGGTTFEDCEVTGIDVAEDMMGTKRVQAVNTNRGTIKTKVVVNCSGVWAPYIGKMAGVRVPQVAYKHAYVVTEAIDGIKTCPNVRDHDGSIYLKRQGCTIQVGGYEPNPIPWDKVEKNFSFGLFDLDWDVFGQHLDAACRRIPAVEESGIRSTVCGPAAEVRGFYHGSAFNSGGMMMGGGAGKQIADWIVHGKPEVDMFSMDIKRFPTKLRNEKTWLKERCHESYAKHYSVAFHHDQSLGGRNQRIDPLYEELLDRGCFYDERHGWERPAYFPGTDKSLPVKSYDFYGQYGVEKHPCHEYNNQLELDYTFQFPGEVHKQIGRECLTCRTSGAIFNTSYMGKLFLSGPNASKVARRIFSRDVTRRHDKCTYTLMLNEQGGIEADLVVATLKDPNGDPVYYLTVGGAATEYCKFHINKIMQDDGVVCNVSEKTDEMGIISVQGVNRFQFGNEAVVDGLNRKFRTLRFPRVGHGFMTLISAKCGIGKALGRRLLRFIMDDPPSLIDSMKFSTWRNITISGQPAILMRISFVGELGYELHCSNEHLLGIYKVLREKSESLGFCDSGYRAMESLSSEIGFHHWPLSIRSDDSPLEANLVNLCDLDDNESVFVGKEKLLQKREEPLKRKIATFTIGEQIPLFGHEAIIRNGQVVGYVRSATYAFALGKAIAVGYIHRPDGAAVDEDFVQSGDYQIKRMGVSYKAEVHSSNPFDPKFKRMMGKYNEKETEDLRSLMNLKYSSTETPLTNKACR